MLMTYEELFKNLWLSVTGHGLSDLETEPLHCILDPPTCGPWWNIVDAIFS